VLARPKFAGAIPNDRRGDILELLTAAAIWVEPTVRVTACSDPGDDKYLELALAASARTIVSSDRHLLVMHPWRQVQILRPAEFLAQRLSGQQ
jgi:uncharacterized protein